MEMDLSDLRSKVKEIVEEYVIGYKCEDDALTESILEANADAAECHELLCAARLAADGTTGYEPRAVGMWPKHLFKNGTSYSKLSAPVAVKVHSHCAPCHGNGMDKSGKSSKAYPSQAMLVEAAILPERTSHPPRLKGFILAREPIPTADEPRLLGVPHFGSTKAETAALNKVLENSGHVIRIKEARRPHDARACRFDALVQASRHVLQSCGSSEAVIAALLEYALPQVGSAMMATAHRLQQLSAVVSTDDDMQEICDGDERIKLEFGDMDNEDEEVGAGARAGAGIESGGHSSLSSYALEDLYSDALMADVRLAVQQAIAYAERRAVCVPVTGGAMESEWTVEWSGFSSQRSLRGLIQPSHLYSPPVSSAAASLPAYVEPPTLATYVCSMQACGPRLQPCAVLEGTSGPMEILYALKHDPSMRHKSTALENVMKGKGLITVIEEQQQSRRRTSGSGRRSTSSHGAGIFREFPTERAVAAAGAGAGIERTSNSPAGPTSSSTSSPVLFVTMDDTATKQDQRMRGLSLGCVPELDESMKTSVRQSVMNTRIALSQHTLARCIPSAQGVPALCPCAAAGRCCEAVRRDGETAYTASKLSSTVSSQLALCVGKGVAGLADLIAKNGGKMPAWWPLLAHRYYIAFGDICVVAAHFQVHCDIVACAAALGGLRDQFLDTVHAIAVQEAARLHLEHVIAPTLSPESETSVAQRKAPPSIPSDSPFNYPVSLLASQSAHKKFEGKEEVIQDEIGPALVGGLELRDHLVTMFRVHDAGMLWFALLVFALEHAGHMVHNYHKEPRKEQEVSYGKNRVAAQNETPSGCEVDVFNPRPCAHVGPCHPSDEGDAEGSGCSCANGHMMCERGCGCPPSCWRRRRGCDCAGRCSSQKSCPCMLEGAECDPNLCGCTAPDVVAIGTCWGLDKGMNVADPIRVNFASAGLLRHFPVTKVAGKMGALPSPCSPGGGPVSLSISSGSPQGRAGDERFSTGIGMELDPTSHAVGPTSNAEGPTSNAEGPTSNAEGPTSNADVEELFLYDSDQNGEDVDENDIAGTGMAEDELDDEESVRRPGREAATLAKDRIYKQAHARISLPAVKVARSKAKAKSKIEGSDQAIPSLLKKATETVRNIYKALRDTGMFRLETTTQQRIQWIAAATVPHEAHVGRQLLLRYVPTHCVNVPVQCKSTRYVSMSKSLIPSAGWGLVYRDDIPADQHDTLGVYSGELISHCESERRGIIDDEFKRSYHMKLGVDRTVDGLQVGSAYRFANHLAVQGPKEVEVIVRKGGRDEGGTARVKEWGFNDAARGNTAFPKLRTNLRVRNVLAGGRRMLAVSVNKECTLYRGEEMFLNYGYDPRHPRGAECRPGDGDGDEDEDGEGGVSRAPSHRPTHGGKRGRGAGDMKTDSRPEAKRSRLAARAGVGASGPTRTSASAEDDGLAIDIDTCGGEVESDSDAAEREHLVAAIEASLKESWGGSSTIDLT